MKPGAAPHPIPSQDRTLLHSGVRTYIHRDSRAAWLDVAGPLSPPVNLRLLLGQLRRAHRRIPRGIDRVGVDLTRFDDVAIELGVVLSLESRLLAVRDIQLGVAVRDTVDASPGALVMMERLQVWRLDDDGVAELTRAAADARLGVNGWQYRAQ